MPLLLLLVLGCVVDRAAWFRLRDDALCALYVDCFDAYADDAACRDDLAAFDDPPCEGFSAAAAADCVAELRAQARDCPADPATWRAPAMCAEVCP